VRLLSASDKTIRTAGVRYSMTKGAPKLGRSEMPKERVVAERLRSRVRDCSKLANGAGLMLSREPNSMDYETHTRSVGVLHDGDSRGNRQPRAGDDIK